MTDASMVALAKWLNEESAKNVVQAELLSKKEMPNNPEEVMVNALEMGKLEGRQQAFLEVMVRILTVIETEDKEINKVNQN